MRTFASDFSCPFLYELLVTLVIFSLGQHSHTKGTCSHFLQRFKVLAGLDLAAFHAVGYFPVGNAGSDFAYIITAAFQASHAYRQVLY
jgi:hypothetical protein